MNAGNRAAIEQRIEELRANHGPGFGPDIVIEDAKDEASPLHTEFEWDVDRAALEHWRETARRIIRVVTVTVQTHKVIVPVPAYVRDPDSKTKEQGYVATAELRSNKDRAWAALAYEIDRADAAIKRAQRVAIAVGLEDDVEFVRSAIASLKSELQQTA